MIAPIFFDMDGTLTEWKPASSYEVLYKKGYFRRLAPHPNIVEAFRIIQKAGACPNVLSCYLADSVYAEEEKLDWSTEHLPDLPPDRILLIPDGVNKAEWLKQHCYWPQDPLTRPVLVDDYTKNLTEWLAAGGVGVKILNGQNFNNKTWKGTRLNVNTNPKLIAEVVLSLARHN